MPPAAALWPASMLTVKLTPGSPPWRSQRTVTLACVSVGARA